MTLRDKIFSWIAFRLPSRLVHYCGIRLWAYATSGEHGDTNVTEVTLLDALDRWEVEDFKGEARTRDAVLSEQPSLHEQLQRWGENRIKDMAAFPHYKAILRCKKCQRVLTQHQVFHSHGVCPLCGENSHSTIVDYVTQATKCSP